MKKESISFGHSIHHIWRWLSFKFTQML